MKITWILGRLVIATLVCTLMTISLGCDNPIVTVQHLLARPIAMFASNPLLPTEDGGTEESGEGKIKFPPASDLVKDWAKPDVALFVTGRLHGYIEPCGCTGLDKQKGGLLRRRTCQKLLLERGWDLVNVDAGNQIRRKGQQAKIKLGTTYDALYNVMGYQAISFGVDDLQIPSIDLLQTIFNLVDEKNPFVCANAGLADTDDAINRFNVVESNGMRIGVTSVIGDEHVSKLEHIAGLTSMPVAQGTNRNRQTAGRKKMRREHSGDAKRSCELCGGCKTFSNF